MPFRKNKMAAYLRSGGFLPFFRSRIKRFCKLFSHVSWSTFEDMPLERRLVKRLNDLEMKTLTEIQQKCFGSVLKGDNVVINSETGSGKTMCYLVPVIDRLMKLKTRSTGPAAVVIVPNMDLGYQVTNLVNKLCDPGQVACPLHRDSPLRINHKYPVIVSTPQTLMQYNIKSFSPIQTVIIDEADLIISNGGKHFWKLLQAFQNHVSVMKNDHILNSETNKTQFIFAAATLPTRGEKSVFRKILNQFPDIHHITSSKVHQYVSSLMSADVFVREENKLPQLLKCLNVLNGGFVPSQMNSRFSDPLKTGVKDGATSYPVFSLSMGRNVEERAWCEIRTSTTNVDHLTSGTQFDQQGQIETVKVLVFANTIAMAENIFGFLNSEEGSIFEIVDNRERSETPLKNSVIRHHFYGDYIKTILANNDKFVTKTGPTYSWRNKVGLLHKRMSRVERQEVLAKFHDNVIVVLVSTDLASRGLDVCDISHVVQVDFARNAADTLHRAGRTARTGKRGTVVNFITEADRDLWKATKMTEKGIGTEGFQEIFSRNRQFSRRIKKRIRHIDDTFSISGKN